MFLNLITSALLINPSLIQSTLKTEVQVNVCDSVSDVSTVFGLDLNKPQSDQTSFFIENKNLDLYHQDWVFKIIKTPGSQTATISLKNNDSEKAASDANTSAKNKKCEYDLHGTFEKLACKMSSEIDLKTLDKNLRDQNYFALLSKEQKQWLSDSGIILPNDLQVSPAFSDRDYQIQSQTFQPVFGISTNFKGQYFLEISLRAEATEDKYVVQKKLIDFLNTNNIQLCSDQSPINTRDKLKSVY